LAVFLLAAASAFAQAKSGIESYNYVRRDNSYLWMPVLHYQSAKGMYAEFRYNYEDVRTVSLFAGKNILVGKGGHMSITPMLGISIGNFKGISLASSADLEWKNWFFSSQMQYSISLSKPDPDFFFCWSEAGTSISSFFFTGLAFQYTRQAGLNDFEPGVLAGFNVGNVSVPFYFFRPFSPDQTLVIGLNYEYRLKAKRKSKGMYLP